MKLVPSEKLVRRLSKKLIAPNTIAMRCVSSGAIPMARH